VSDSVERLGDSRYVFATVWVLLNATNQLVHGEIHDSDGHLCARFKRWEDMTERLRSAIVGLPPTAF
jgi:hypothetical protein